EERSADKQPRYPWPVGDADYCSGDEYEVEYLSHRLTFNRHDFEERVVAAAVKLGLVAANELDEDETDDLVELASQGWIEKPRSRSGSAAGLRERAGGTGGSRRRGRPFARAARPPRCAGRA